MISSQPVQFPMLPLHLGTISTSSIYSYINTQRDYHGVPRSDEFHVSQFEDVQRYIILRRLLLIAVCSPDTSRHKAFPDTTSSWFIPKMYYYYYFNRCIHYVYLCLLVSLTSRTHAFHKKGV